MRPSDGRISLWPLAIIGFIVILGAACITSVERLNKEPPRDFVALKTSARGANAAEAARYWQTAVEVVQWRYDRTSPLPEAAPAEFCPGDAGKADAAVRLAYWAKLREEWLKPDSWHRTISFDMSWMINDVESIWHGFRDFALDHT
jgi:hypothetical protein